MKFAIGLAIAISGLFFGCATPYGSSATPHASAAISNDVTSATLNMGAIGEFTFVASHSHSTDGASTGTVTITGTKNTMNTLGSGAIGALGGLIAGRVIP